MPHIGSTRHMLTLSVSRHLESTPSTRRRLLKNQGIFFLASIGCSVPQHLASLNCAAKPAMNSSYSVPQVCQRQRSSQ
ncbi:hypothetical protein [Cutibacterium acnes]|uniref:hypothetical protein n=1 Tax=Cutibacterium acnes TaxID=1747 RepID=UPI0001F092A5|nr:hypothetical protein [Cutibacterium acnes]EFT76675.1 hypothetical protein HMPREF9599_02029 [Cutibacterium acnes HL050PA2]